MVFVKVRETYDLHTVKNKMTVIGIHTPKPDIIKANYPGLLMQCKAYRPVKCDVRVACASTLPLDPQGVGLTEGDVAPEDLFNPILFKAISNVGMSQLEARIVQQGIAPGTASGNDVVGSSAAVDVDDVTTETDEFPIYYGLLSNAHGWRHANPQQGLELKDLRPYVFEMLYNIADGSPAAQGGVSVDYGVPYPSSSAAKLISGIQGIRGNAKPIPFISCTSYTGASVVTGFVSQSDTTQPRNASTEVPWINCMVGAIIVPPSRLHELFYRMVVEWTIEFSGIRPIGEITSWAGLSAIADITHYQNYSFEATKKALGVDSDIMDHDQTMVSANVELNKVM